MSPSRYSNDDKGFSHHTLPEHLRKMLARGSGEPLSSEYLSSEQVNTSQNNSLSSSQYGRLVTEEGGRELPAKPVNLLAKAVAILSRREHSEAELRRKLTQYSEDEKAIDAVIARLQRENWQSDQRFAENFVALRQERWGNQKILHALRGHQLDEDTVSQLKDTLKETEFDRALAVWERKFHGRLPTTPQEKAKQMRFLASRGFSADIVRKVLSYRFASNP